MKSPWSFFLPLLSLIFITLKIIGYISWSWWLVLLPIYGPLALILFIFIIGLLVAFIVGGFK
jgi:hypothetical protein